MCNGNVAEGPDWPEGTTGPNGEDGVNALLTERKDGTCTPHHQNSTYDQFYIVERLTTSLASFYVSDSTILVDDATVTTSQKLHRYFALMTQGGAAFFIIFSAICVFSMGVASYRYTHYYRALKNHHVPQHMPSSTQGIAPPPSSRRWNIPSSVYLQFITQARWKLDHFRQSRRGPRRGMSSAARKQFEEEGKTTKEARGVSCFSRNTPQIFTRGAIRGGHNSRDGLVTLHDIYGGAPDTCLTMVGTDSNLSENMSEDAWAFEKT